MVMALAGRRIDAADSGVERFPLANVDLVRTRLRALLQQHQPRTLVCSAACGADLLALAEAEAMGIRRRIVLPYDAVRFRRTSVIDRPGSWTSDYDRLIAQAEASGDLIVLDAPESDGAPGASVTDEISPYARANDAILEEAARLAAIGGAGEPVTAVLVWDGGRREDDDLTARFGAAARAAGLRVEQVPTL